MTIPITEIRTTTYSYVFSPYAEPIASVRPGRVLDIYTDDAFGSRVPTSEIDSRIRC